MLCEVSFPVSQFERPRPSAGGQSLPRLRAQMRRHRHFACDRCLATIDAVSLFSGFGETFAPAAMYWYLPAAIIPDPSFCRRPRQRTCQ
jgi:hypothetical protein